MKLLFGYPDAVADWVGRRIETVGSGPAFGKCYAIGAVNDEGALGAGAVYHNWQPQFGGIEISFAKDPAAQLTRGVIGALLRYPFVTLECKRITACAPLKATSTRDFLEKLGFKREGVVRLGFGNDHAVVYGMLARKEWANSPFFKSSAEVWTG